MTTAITPQAIALLPPHCEHDELMAASRVLKAVVKRLDELPPELATIVLHGGYTLSQLEMIILAARSIEKKMAGLSEPMDAWVRGSAALSIKVEDSGEQVP